MGDKIIKGVLALVMACGAFTAILMFFKSSDPAWLCVALGLGLAMSSIDGQA